MTIEHIIIGLLLLVVLGLLVWIAFLRSVLNNLVFIVNQASEEIKAMAASRGQK